MKFLNDILVKAGLVVKGTLNIGQETGVLPSYTHMTTQSNGGFAFSPNSNHVDVVTGYNHNTPVFLLTNNITSSTQNIPTATLLRLQNFYNGPIGATVWGTNALYPERRSIESSTAMWLPVGSYSLYGNYSFPNAGHVNRVYIGANQNTTSGALNVYCGGAPDSNTPNQGTSNTYNQFRASSGLSGDNNTTVRNYTGFYTLYTGGFHLFGGAGSTISNIIYYAAGEFDGSNGSMSVSNAYGMYIAGMKQSWISNAWGIYQIGTNDKNFFGGNVLIGSNTLYSSAQVSIDSTSKGFLPPRMTSAQKGAIASPATGLIVYQTDSAEGLYQYKSTGWESLGGGTGLPSQSGNAGKYLTTDGTTASWATLSGGGANIYNTDGTLTGNRVLTANNTLYFIGTGYKKIYSGDASLYADFNIRNYGLDFTHNESNSLPTYNKQSRLVLNSFESYWGQNGDQYGSQEVKILMGSSYDLLLSSTSHIYLTSPDIDISTTGYFSISTGSTPVYRFRVSGTGDITASNLSGTGTRMVVADATGLLGVQAIPSGVIAGGTTGQILAKNSGTDYDTIWIDNYTSVVKHEVKLGATLSKGTPVYVSSGTGGSGTNMIVSAASNASEATSSKTMGLLITGGVTNDFAYVATEGLVAGLDTSSALSVGDPVWLGPSGTLLYGLASKPVAPAHMVFIGIVTRIHGVNGEIFVKVQNGFELHEIHDVSVPSYVSNGVLYRDTVNNLWKHDTIANVLGYTPVSTVGYNNTSWDTAYTNRITSLTTTGSSGAATLSSNVLNIPNYTLAGLGGQPLDADLTAIAGLAGTSGLLKKTAADTWTLDTNTYLTANQSISFTPAAGGDVTGSSSGVTSLTPTLVIGTNKVTNAMLAQIATGTFHGRTTAGTGNVETLTGTQATALLDTFSSTLKGLVPASGGGTTTYLRADGTWATPAGGGGSSMTWNVVTGTSQTAVSNNGYIANNAALVTVTLPATAAVGDVIEVVAKGAGGWKLAQGGASNIVKFGKSQTTTGTGGYMQSNATNDAIRIVCSVANSEWIVLSAVGNITLI